MNKRPTRQQKRQTGTGYSAIGSSQPLARRYDEMLAVYAAAIAAGKSEEAAEAEAQRVR